MTPLRVTLLSAVVAVAACTATRDPDPTPLPPPTATTLTWTHVENGRIVDAYGRHVLLRGVNLKAKTLFDVDFDDGRKSVEVVPPFDQWDVDTMVRLGYNFVRLCINWSGLEPEEGKFSDTYLAELDRVVGLLTAGGVYVLIDFHEDAWSKEIGEDGAPYWAIVPPPPKKLEGPFDDGPGLPCPCINLDERRGSEPVLAAFTSFFDNREKIQDRFWPAWRLVAARYAKNPGVIGYEAMNEPVVTHVGDGQRKLMDFHVNAVREMRKVNKHAAYWYEPDVVTRNFGMKAPAFPGPAPDDNLVYTPHLYPPFDVLKDAASRERLATSFDDMVKEAEYWNAAVVIGEWWTWLGDEKGEYLKFVTGLARERNIGWALWMWKFYGDLKEPTGGGSVIDYTDPGYERFISEPGATMLRTPTVFAVPGDVLENAYPPANGEGLRVRFRTAGGEGPLLVYLPDDYWANGYHISVDGKVPIAVDVSAAPRVTVEWDGRAGEHEVVVQSNYE